MNGNNQLIANNMKVKVFYNLPHQIQEPINKWLSENQNIKVITVTQSQLHRDEVTLIILYNE